MEAGLGKTIVNLPGKIALDERAVKLSSPDMLLTSPEALQTA